MPLNQGIRCVSAPHGSAKKPLWANTPFHRAPGQRPGRCSTHAAEGPLQPETFARFREQFGPIKCGLDGPVILRHETGGFRSW